MSVFIFVFAGTSALTREPAICFVPYPDGVFNPVAIASLMHRNSVRLRRQDSARCPFAPGTASAVH